MKKIEEETIKCVCGDIFKEIKLTKHIRYCKPFLERFKLFDFKITSILEKYSSGDENNIYLLKYLFKSYVKLIDQIIKQRQKNSNKFKTYKSCDYVSNEKGIYNNKKCEQLNSIINEEIETPSYDNKNTPHKFKTSKSCIVVLNKSIACKKKLKCGHNCPGAKHKKDCCLPCLDKNCKNYVNIENQSSDTNCQICLKKLSDSPIVNLKCNHYIHYFCIINKLNEFDDLFGKKINFDWFKCPVCNNLLECDSISILKQRIKIILDLNLKIRNMIEQRLKLYKNINSNKDIFNIFIFYYCSRCLNPYYAGLNKDNNKNEFFGNVKDCLCGKDSFLLDAQGKSSCEKHGIEYIEYKCKFCCNIASRFFSNTHFCEECYKNKKVGNNQLCSVKICDKESCEFRGEHAPNGTEYCLGCFICRFNNLDKI